MVDPPRRVPSTDLNRDPDLTARTGHGEHHTGYRWHAGDPAWHPHRDGHDDDEPDGKAAWGHGETGGKIEQWDHGEDS